MLLITEAKTGMNVGAHLSHRIKAEDITVMYFTEGEHGCQIHKTGCAHQKKAYNTLHLGQTATETIGEDDWFYVAPCARKA